MARELQMDVEKGCVDDSLDENHDKLTLKNFKYLQKKWLKKHKKVLWEREERNGTVFTNEVDEFLQKWDDMQRFALFAAPGQH